VSRTTVSGEPVGVCVFTSHRGFAEPCRRSALDARATRLVPSSFQTRCTLRAVQTRAKKNPPFPAGLPSGRPDLNRGPLVPQTAPALWREVRRRDWKWLGYADLTLSENLTRRFSMSGFSNVLPFSCRSAMAERAI
jgi:hypothetical protein